MSWTKLEHRTPRHPKILRLAAELAIARNEARGLCMSLWCAVAQDCPDGRLGDRTAAEVAYLADYDRDPEPLLDAMLRLGLLDRAEDGSLWVHDWMDYAGAWREAQRSRDRRSARTRPGRDHANQEAATPRAADEAAPQPPARPPPHQLDHHLTSLLDWWRWEPSAPDWCPAPRRTARLVERWPALVAAVAPDLTAAAPDLQERLRRYVIAAWESAWVSERRLSGAWLLGTDARAADAGELEQRVANILDGVGAEVVPLPDRRARGPSGFELAAEVAAEMEADFAAAEAARRG